MSWHTVQQGECLSSIGEEFGVSWSRIWDDSANAELRTNRDDPNVLRPGDQLFVPDKQPREEQGATERRHTFRRLGVPCRLKLLLLRNGKPRRGERYLLEVDGEVVKQGAVPEEGWIDEPIPPHARHGQLILADGKEKYPLSIGGLDPLDTFNGVQGRLKNLGYEPGPVDGRTGPRTEAAVRAFQKDHEPLAADGIAGPKTRARLKDEYGC